MVQLLPNDTLHDMKAWQRVKLSLGLGLSLWLFWAWLAGDFEFKPLRGEALEWADYAQRHLLEVMPEAGTPVYPLSPPDGEGTYLFQAFAEEGSTMEIWKMEPRAGNPGAEVAAMAGGLVLLAEDLGSDWHGTVILLHRVRKEGAVLVESMYAGLDRVDVAAGQWVRAGQVLGRLDQTQERGLQWEVRESLGLGISPGTLEDLRGWVQPSAFVKKYRGGSVSR
ncbi:MAG: M23 family metallopeptidase [Blastochloris sp.]|nr:M23 family metallopeptidase [Blastochloris sp.]